MIVNIFHELLVNDKFISISCPCLSRNGIFFPGIPAHVVRNIPVTGVSVCFGFLADRCVCQFGDKVSLTQRRVVSTDIYLITAVMPVFAVIVGNVTELGIHMTRIGCIYGISQTILMTVSNGKTSVTELAVPSVFTVVGLTTGVLNLDSVYAIVDFKCHRCSAVFADMPRQTGTFLECTFTEQTACKSCHACNGCCRRSCNHSECSSTGCELLTKIKFAHWYYPPIKIRKIKILYHARQCKRA